MTIEQIKQDKQRDIDLMEKEDLQIDNEIISRKNYWLRSGSSNSESNDYRLRSGSSDSENNDCWISSRSSDSESNESNYSQQNPSNQQPVHQRMLKYIDAINMPEHLREALR
ncbi:868_t:CDS:2, partial [Funneliformis caledonium]